jgi:hypothetical protein
MKPYLYLSALSIAVAFAVSANAVPSGTEWNEDGDAGDLLGTAQSVSGGGALTAINGAIAASDADLYLISVLGGGVFSATTVGTVGTLSDTQLYLFDAGGMGVEGNDDFSGSIVRSALPAGGLSPATAGLYYLAISTYNRDPVSGGLRIFPDTFPGVYGPTGPGGGSPLSGWVNTTSAAGTYRIELTGATFVTTAGVPEASCTLSLLGLAVFGLGVLRRKLS